MLHDEGNEPLYVTLHAQTVLGLPDLELWASGLH